MSIETTTHLNFRGDAREALEFYRSAFGGEISLFTYADAHAVTDPAEAGQVMWGQVKAGNGGDRAIVTTSSGAGLHGNVGQPNYAAAKAGIAAMTVVGFLILVRVLVSPL